MHCVIHYHVLVSEIDIISDTHCSVVLHSFYYNLGQELQSWYELMIHCLSDLHIFTIAVEYLVFTEISTSVWRCSILYRT